MSHSVRHHLRLEIDEYDATIRRFIPEYETMLGVAADAVASVDPALVVDLGCGTGALSEAILSSDRVRRAEVLDIDPEMMDQARARLGRFGDRVSFSLRSYDEVFAPCDAFAASLSLHHLPTLESKGVLFSRAHAALRPGGVLVNADVNMPASLEERASLYRVWADHLVANGIPQERAWRHFEEWSEEDTYLPLEAELGVLRDLGFEAERIWSAGPVGVVVARKS
jgi:SAM-dependent methyltransferase